ncbi:MAG: carbohydrate binding domain-containing protein [Candidatus Sumerlaeota bacterium]|nr:carbohydrate binding domain-containing protein [Candidatus Sumerlaeota bacterium]
MKPFAAASFRLGAPLLGLTALFLAGVETAGAVDETTPGWFPFVIPSLDSSKTPLDLSFLNPDPAGAKGRVRVADGHFVDGAGQRIRFLGTNATFDAALPPKDLAPQVAAHLRKLGINLVRFHHLDSSASPRGILQKDKKTFDPEMLDRLFFYMNELKKNGVYININLHVGRHYPGLPSDLPYAFRMGKVVDRFYRPLLDMQKEYARELLATKNPYSGFPLAKDPAVLTVEMNNENTLIDASPADLDALPDPIRPFLVGLWREWLTRRYPSDEALRKAWSEGLAPSGAEMLQNGDFAAGLAPWSVQKMPPVEAVVEVRPSEGPEGAPALVAQITKPGSLNWACQVHYNGLTLKDGAPYSLSFDAFAPKKGSLSVSVMKDHEPYGSVGLRTNASVGPQWKHFEHSFVTKGVEGTSRISFNFGGEPFEARIARVSLQPGSGATYDRVNSATRAAADLPKGSASRNQERDFKMFRFETERANSRELADYLRKDLGAEASIVDTQASYGALAGVYREAAISDQIDMHAYWQHPQFPGKPWDPVNWRIKNTPMSADPKGGTLVDRARLRLQGKPFTMSEYNHPFPSFYEVEMFPMYSTFGSFQNWDAIYQFTYRNNGTEWDNRKSSGFFNLDGNSGQLAFAPFAALTFRTGAFETNEPPAVLEIPADGVKFLENLESWNVDSLWAQAGAPDLLALHTPIALELKDGIDAPTPRAPKGMEWKNMVSMQGPIQWDAENSVYQAVSDRSIALTGAIADPTRAWKMGPFRLTLEKTSNGYATFAAATLDGRSFVDSEKILLVLANREENTGMGWNEDHTSVGKNWGQAPLLVEGVKATLEVPASMQVESYALDATGGTPTLVEAQVGGSMNTFALQEKTLWYLLTKRRGA